MVDVFLQAGNVIVRLIVQTKRMNLTLVKRSMRVHVTQPIFVVVQEDVSLEGGGVIMIRIVEMGRMKSPVLWKNTEPVLKMRELAITENVFTIVNGVMVLMTVVQMIALMRCSVTWSVVKKSLNVVSLHIVFTKNGGVMGKEIVLMEVMN
jgi:hypothetical protein